jgi:putative ABC transport system permease protein
MAAHPPRLASWLLRRILPPDHRETVAGDLEELWRTDARLHGSAAGRRWFWRQVLSLAWSRLFTRRPRSFAPSPRRGEPMHGLWLDIRYAIRTLLKTPAFTLIAILTLAIGIGANTAIFTIVHALLLKPLPFAKPDELMVVHILAPDREANRGGQREIGWSYPKYEVFRDTQRVFSDHAVFNAREWTLTEAGDAERIRGEAVGAHYLTTLGVTPILGRDFTPDEDRAPGMEGVVLLGHGLWQRRFGADPAIVGQVLRLNSKPYTVVGVLPPGFRGLSGDAQLWAPVMTLDPAAVGAKWNHWLYLVARRRPAVTAAQAHEAVALLGPHVDEVIGQPPGASIPKLPTAAAPLDAARVDPLIRRSVLVLLGAVALVLLIGCVNLANLITARSEARRREVAVRLALGATRGRVMRQLLAESLVLAGAGACAGLAIAYGMLAGAAALLPASGIMPRPRTFGLTRVTSQMIALDLPTLAFTLAATVTTALLFGLLPAWRASRADLAGAMKRDGSGSIGSGARGVGARLFGGRSLVVSLETAFALVLLVASGLMIQSVRNLQRTELGFRSEHLVTAGIQLAAQEYDAGRSPRFFADLLTRLRGIPGVEAAAYASCAPVSGACELTPVRLLDRPPAAPGAEPPTGIIHASPDLFRTLGARLVKGRLFTDADIAERPRVVIINETLARLHFGPANPIGQRIALGINGFSSGAEIVGVVGDLRYMGVEAPARADTYVPLFQSARQSGLLFVRTTLDPSAVASAIRREVVALDAKVPVNDVKTMSVRFEEATWRTRLSADLLTLFAGVALLLAAIGVYGVMAQSVQLRTREIGLRLALGADRRAIFAHVIGRALWTVSIGAAIGVGLSLVSMRWLESLLYEVRPTDPLTIVVIAIMLVVVSMVASYVPARRAMRVDPLTSLRTE